MQISEIYSSKQGEGILTGQQSTFIRTSGCNLRCGFCDTPYTSWSPEGNRQTIAQIVEKVRACDTRFVVITGGEPMLSREIESLTMSLRSLDYHITIETAGTIDRQVACDLMSISPKMSNSTPSRERAGQWFEKHEKLRLQPEIVRQLIDRFDYQLKFVVQTENDLKEITEFCDAVGNVKTERILLMPEGTSTDLLDQRSQWIRDICDKHGFTFCPRMHIYWYGNTRGT